MAFSLTPEEMQALEALPTLSGEEARLQRQLAQAAALRDRPMPKHSTVGGSILGGIGNLIGYANGTNMARGAEAALGDVRQKMSAGEALKARLEAMKAQQGLQAGDQQIAAQKSEMERKAAEAERAGQAIAPELGGLLQGLTGQNLGTLTNRDLGPGSELARALAARRDAQAERAMRREERGAAQKAAGEKRTADTEEGLRKELMSNPVTKQMQDVAAGFERVKFATQNPSAAGDMALVFGFVKMLDPGSTVREGEAASAEQAQGVPSRVLNIYNKVVSGERLPPDVRADFLRQSQGLFQAQMGRYKALADSYSGLARGAGADPSRVAIPLGLEGAGAASAPSGLTAAEAAELQALEAKFGGKK